MFLKRTKYVFTHHEVSYLGHIISEEGVKADPSKVEAMLKWPKPINITALHGFLGLTSYYRRFVKDYGKIAESLTQMLHKNKFIWTTQSEMAFEQLRAAMTQAPVLALPDFCQVFIVVCDTSEVGVRAVLQQEGRPVSFFSRPFSRHHMKLPAYEKELIGLAKAVRHWRSYLWGRRFVVRTDHCSLKFLL